MQIWIITDKRRQDEPESVDKAGTNLFHTDIGLPPEKQNFHFNTKRFRAVLSSISLTQSSILMS